MFYVYIDCTAHRLAGIVMIEDRSTDHAVKQAFDEQQCSPAMRFNPLRDTRICLRIGICHRFVPSDRAKALALNHRGPDSVRQRKLDKIRALI